ncbi:transmembrane protein 54 [Tiliqua scincoides]|uniref:transmembrane protein 54 n=1 Tax=Tiliqua scincoides TaxID=71010 RepID=UPI003461EA41
MKTGLILIVIGHLNFITGALVHGMVLRHIANPQDSISLNYAISNVIMVISAILTISCGIAAIVLSRYVLSSPLQGWAVASLSIGSALLSLLCLGGLAFCIILTFVNRGRALLAMCTFADMELIQITHECPFDPTRIYSSALALWSLSFLLDGVEIVFSIRCFLFTLVLLDVRLCHRRTRKKKVLLQMVAAESSGVCEGRNLLRADRVETVWL